MFPDNGRFGIPKRFCANFPQKMRETLRKENKNFQQDFTPRKKRGGIRRRTDCRLGGARVPHAHRSAARVAVGAALSHSSMDCRLGGARIPHTHRSAPLGLPPARNSTRPTVCDGFAYYLRPPFCRACILPRVGCRGAKFYSPDSLRRVRVLFAPAVLPRACRSAALRLPFRLPPTCTLVLPANPRNVRRNPFFRPVKF